MVLKVRVHVLLPVTFPDHPVFFLPPFPDAERKILIMSQIGKLFAVPHIIRQGFAHHLGGAEPHTVFCQVADRFRVLWQGTVCSQQI